VVKSFPIRPITCDHRITRSTWFVYHLINFSLTPPPLVIFVANKGQSAIRPDGDRTVESLFSRFFDLELRSIFSRRPNRKIYSSVNTIQG
jgi:hypothetical protein